MEKKKINVIESLGNTDKLMVQKSKPLFALWQSELTLAEFKILDTYLGRINSHDDEHRTVKFKKGELEELLGVKQIKPQVLDERLKHLMTTVRIPDANNKKGFTRISLFEKAHAEQDEYGIWEAELTCTESAKQYIFNIEDLQYLRYKLKNIVNIKSRYAYIMFLYIWDNKYHGTWEISLDALKNMLGCEKEETYKVFKRFNDLILKKIHKEIHKVTDIKYDYETVKKGRSVVGIRFIYKSKEILEDVIPDQITIEQILENKEMWEKELDCFKFSEEQLEEIRQVMYVIPMHKLPQSPEPACYNDLNVMRYHYIKLKIADIQRRDKESKIKNKYAYLLKTLKKDADIE